MSEPLSLFDRGEYGISVSATADNSAIEHERLPKGQDKERDLVLILSFEDEEGREAVIEALNLYVRRTGNVWKTWWPEAPDRGVLSLDL